MATVPTPKRGEVWLVRFDPSAGAEIRKVRPAVVVNLDAIGRLPLRIVVPVTDSKSDFGNLSWFVFLPAASENGLSKDSGADAFQLKSVSETRFVRKLGEVTNAQIDVHGSGKLYRNQTIIIQGRSRPAEGQRAAGDLDRLRRAFPQQAGFLSERPDVIAAVSARDKEVVAPIASPLATTFPHVLVKSRGQHGM